MEPVMIIKVSKRKMSVVDSQGVYEGSTINLIEKILTPYGYMKINQTKVIHLPSVVAVENGYVVMENGERCKVSRLNQQRLLKRLQNMSKSIS